MQQTLQDFNKNRARQLVLDQLNFSPRSFRITATVRSGICGKDQESDAGFGVTEF